MTRNAENIRTEPLSSLVFQGVPMDSAATL